ncbi:MAG: UDP-N-acetylglucosamine 2-epimerase (non-hydrolyzing) [Phycisphaerae bacterium]
MSARRILTVVGARPQFVKAAAVSRAVAAHNAAGPAVRVDERLLHTGQHYDENLSAVFFDELAIPAPVHQLDAGGGSHAAQTAAMLAGIEAAVLADRPDWVLVYGDTNSTLAGALAAAKCGVPIAHVEAGLRSFDRRMPEEINRLLTDRVATLRLCPTPVAVANLSAEGIDAGVRLCGDVMYDAALFFAAAAERRSSILGRLELKPREYIVATIHRAENADHPAALGAILDGLSAAPLPVVWPVHPRTRLQLGQRRLPPPIRTIDPLPYLDMIALLRQARCVATDSGGLQKEAYFFERPCITLRERTEWVELVDAGWNRLTGADAAAIGAALDWALRFVPPARPELYGSGRAAAAVVRELLAA